MHLRVHHSFCLRPPTKTDHPQQTTTKHIDHIDRQHQKTARPFPSLAPASAFFSASGRDVQRREAGAGADAGLGEPEADTRCHLDTRAKRGGDGRGWSWRWAMTC